MSQAIREALRTKYAAPEWALLEEVRHRATGGERSADAIACNLWESNAYKIIGFEIKSSRADWLRELKDPSKADVIAAFCDEWFIVTPPGLVKPDELPQAWGLMELKGNGLHTVRKAPRLEDRRTLTRGFVASMVRRAVSVGERDITQAIADAKRQAQADAQSWAKQEAERRTSQLTSLCKKLENIKALTGIDLADWELTDEDVAAAIRFGIGAAKSGVTGYYGGLLQLQSALRALDKSITELGPIADACAIPRQREKTT
jgi:hypothetical protein